MNKLTARRLAVTTWLNLTRHYPTNMIELSQFNSYFEIRFFGDAGEAYEKEVIDKIPEVSPKDVRLHTNVFDNEGSWCLHIEFGYE